MSDLDGKEQENVRRALRSLRLRLGGWTPVAAALGCTLNSLEKISGGKRGVTASVAFRVARLVEVPIDDLLAGKFAPPGQCPYCGRGSDFGDEHTAVDGAPRPTPRPKLVPVP